MSDKKISELTNITGANLADADEFVVVDTSASETKAITWAELKEGLDTGTGFVRITGDTMTGNLSFGDNDKAIFGAGSDLQIYHDGDNSYITDSGTGELRIRGTDLRIQNAAGTANYIRGNDAGDVGLFYNGSLKLATTSTGVDVTGTITADALTVEGGQAVVSRNNTTDQLVVKNSQAGSSATPQYSDITFEGYATNDRARIRGVDRAANFLRGGLTIQTQNTSLALTDRIFIDGDGDISFYEDTGTTPKFFWDASAESLGIGTTDPSSLDVAANDLVIGGGSGNRGLTVFSGTSSTGGILFADGNDGSVAEYRGWVSYDHSTDALRFASASAERMRIDASGTLLVGKTSASISTAGFQANTGGDTYHVVDGGITAYFNRLTSDGDIAQFRKDGTTVGSIGNSGANLTIGNGDTGLNFAASADTIIPWNTSTNSNTDGNLSLGNSSNRFKDLYLSGGVYLGGTGAANLLDDYEEGTFTLTTDSDATGVLSVNSGRYRKVGNIVTVNIALNVSTDFTGSSISGLPFFPQSEGTVSGMFVVAFNGTGNLFCQINDNNVRVYFRSSSDVLDTISPATSWGATNITFTYTTE